MEVIYQSLSFMSSLKYERSPKILLKWNVKIFHFCLHPCCKSWWRFMGTISLVSPSKAARAIRRFAASVGWKASQNTCLSRSEHNVEMRGRQVITPLYWPTPQHPDLPSVKPLSTFHTFTPISKHYTILFSPYYHAHIYYYYWYANYHTHITKGNGFYPSVHSLYPISINATNVQWFLKIHKIFM